MTTAGAGCTCCSWAAGTRPPTSGRRTDGGSLGTPPPSCGGRARSERSSEMLLKDRVAIVSGIGPGIGRHTALAFAREGADVALGARTGDRLEQVAAEVEALGRRAVWRTTDVTVEAECSALAEAAVSELGRIDVLVNNAFVQPPIETIEENTLDTWRRA